MTKHVSVSAILSSDVTKAYAWLRDQRDERDERLDEQGADRTAQCLRSADGVFRAPLAVLIERGESTEDDDSTESEMDNGDLEEEDTLSSSEEFESYFARYFPNDHYAQLADHLGIEEDGVQQTYDEMETAPASKPVLVSNLLSNNPATRHLTAGKTVIRIYNRYLKQDRTSWKENTSAPKQCLRHA